MTETTETRGRRKTRQGVVVSDKMEKTVLVQVGQLVKHPLYGKIIRRNKKYKVHDEDGVSAMGDTVEIMECRPVSREKRWRVVRVVEKAK